MENGFWKRFIKQGIFRDFSPDSFWERLLLKIPFIRRWYLRRIKKQMERAAYDIQQSMIDTFERGLKLLESLEPIPVYPIRGFAVDELVESLEKFRKVGLNPHDLQPFIYPLPIRGTGD